MSNTPKIEEIFAPLIDSPSLTLTSTYWNGAKEMLHQLLLEVIETKDLHTDSASCDKLRQEQRQKLSELFKKEK